MEVLEVISPLFGARCCVVVAEQASCVVVDPGALVADTVVALVAQRGLRPRAVLATHGHADHTWDAGRLSDRFGVPVLVHADDVYRLADPWGTLGVLGAAVGSSDGPLAAELRRLGADPSECVAPHDVRPVCADGAAEERLSFGELSVVARHAPGHTEGSVVYVLEPPDERPIALTGDVLFAGAVGRTDLPGGDAAAMSRTLRTVVRTLPPRAVVLPGHGPATDLATELVRNPYLR